MFVDDGRSLLGNSKSHLRRYMCVCVIICVCVCDYMCVHVVMVFSLP